MFLAIDTETYLVRPGLLTPRLVCLSWSDGNRTELLGREEGVKFVRRALADPSINIVGHRVAYDLAVICVQAPDLLYPIFEAFENGRIYDTKIDQQLCDIATSELEFFNYKAPDGTVKRMLNKHSLQQYVLRYLHRDITKGKGSFQLRFAELDGMDVEDYPEEARKYALEDAQFTWEINKKQLELAGAEIPTRVLQTKSAWALHLMSVWGIRANKQRTFALRDRLVIEKGEIQDKLVEAGLIRKIGLTKDLKLIRDRVVRAYTNMSVEIPTTEKGNVSTDREVLESSGDAELALIAKFTSIDKELNTFVPLLMQATDQPFCASYNCLVSSGRTSSGSSDNVGNAQNLPADGEIRACFEPRPGNYYCSVDYTTAELRALSEVNIYLFGHSVMGEELNRDMDPHLSFAASVLNISYEQALRNKEDKTVNEHRKLGKVFNFGCGGGMREPSLVEYAKGFGVALSLDKARELYSHWVNHYHEMKDFFRHNKSLTSFGGTTTLRHPLTGFVRGGQTYTMLSNFWFQNLTACLAKDALYEVTKEAYLNKTSPLYGSRCVGFLHDEILMEQPIDRAHEAAHRQTEIMLSSAKKYLKKIKVKASPALMTYWTKEAKEKFDERGRLIPWGL